MLASLEKSTAESSRGGPAPVQHSSWRKVSLVRRGQQNYFVAPPRGKFDDKDHGYREEYGSKDAHKTESTLGYRAGYEAVMGNRY